MPAIITFEMRGIQELQDRLNRGDTIMKISLNDGLRAIGRLFVPTKGTGPLADETPKRTGKLARSTFFRITEKELQELIILQPAQTPEEYGAMFYGWFVREGTEPHEIRPRLAKALHFFIGEDEIFATRVNHPGTKANPYHVRVLERLMPDVQGIVEQIGLRIVAYLSGKEAL
jgi:hypothetical protein